MKFDFALILTVLTLLCGAFWLVDKLVLAKRRGPDGKPNDTVDFFASLFPVLAVVLCLRSFVYEPFRIPSSSMMPTLLIGDFILVNKFAYGVRLPVTNTVLFETGTPERGDVVVFRYPGRNPPVASDPPVGTDTDTMPPKSVGRATVSVAATVASVVSVICSRTRSRRLRSASASAMNSAQRAAGICAPAVSSSQFCRAVCSSV